MERLDGTDKEIAEADRFLDHCKGGRCTLPIKCGIKADQEFLDDVGKRTKRRIRTMMKIKNMDYNKLVANKALREKFEKAIKRAIARKCGNGVTDDHVVLALSEGSVNVDVTIIPDDDSAADAIVKTIDSGAKEMSDEVVNDVKAVEGIKDVETAPITADAASTAEIEKSTAIEPVAPTGEPLIDPANEGPSPSPGPTPDDGAVNKGAGGGWMMFVVTGILCLVVAGGAAFFLNKKTGPKPRGNPGVEMGSV